MFRFNNLGMLLMDKFRDGSDYRRLHITPISKLMRELERTRGRKLSIQMRVEMRSVYIEWRKRIKQEREKLKGGLEGDLPKLGLRCFRWYYSPLLRKTTLGLRLFEELEREEQCLQRCLDEIMREELRNLELKGDLEGDLLEEGLRCFGGYYSPLLRKTDKLIVGDLTTLDLRLLEELEGEEQCLQRWLDEIMREELRNLEDLRLLEEVKKEEQRCLDEIKREELRNLEELRKLEELRGLEELTQSQKLLGRTTSLSLRVDIKVSDDKRFSAARLRPLMWDWDDGIFSDFSNLSKTLLYRSRQVLHQLLLEILLEKLVRCVVFTAAVVLYLFEYLMGYIERGGWATYCDTSWEFRATYVSIELRLAAYFWFKFRAWAPSTEGPPRKRARGEIGKAPICHRGDRKKPNVPKLTDLEGKTVYIFEYKTKEAAASAYWIAAYYYNQLRYFSDDVLKWCQAHLPTLPNVSVLSQSKELWVREQVQKYGRELRRSGLDVVEQRRAARDVAPALSEGQEGDHSPTDDISGQWLPTGSEHHDQGRVIVEQNLAAEDVAEVTCGTLERSQFPTENVSKTSAAPSGGVVVEQGLAAGDEAPMLSGHETYPERNPSPDPWYNWSPLPYPDCWRTPSSSPYDGKLALLVQRLTNANPDQAHDSTGDFDPGQHAYNQENTLEGHEGDRPPSHFDGVAVVEQRPVAGDVASALSEGREGAHPCVILEQCVPTASRHQDQELIVSREGLNPPTCSDQNVYNQQDVQHFERNHGCASVLEGGGYVAEVGVSFQQDETEEYHVRREPADHIHAMDLTVAQEVKELKITGTIRNAIRELHNRGWELEMQPNVSTEFSTTYTVSCEGQRPTFTGTNCLAFDEINEQGFKIILKPLNTAPPQDGNGKPQGTAPAPLKAGVRRPQSSSRGLCRNCDAPLLAE